MGGLSDGELSPAPAKRSKTTTVDKVPTESRKPQENTSSSKTESKSSSKTESKSSSKIENKSSSKTEDKSSSKSEDKSSKPRRRHRSRSHSRDRSYRRKDTRRSYHDYDQPREEESYQRYYGDDYSGGSKRRYDEREEDNTVGSRYYDVEAKKQEPEEPPKPKERERKTVDLLTSRTGGAYIPPAKLRLMQAGITDKSSAAYQRIAWEALKKSIHGHINKINTSNIRTITHALLRENIVRGRGLLCKSIIQAQTASPTFTPVYAALVSVLNSRFPHVGELLLRRLVLTFKRAFQRGTKPVCLAAVTFIAHLVNQRVAHEIVALEVLTLLVERPTDDGIEVAIAFLKECGQKLTEVSSKGINAIFEMLRNILHEGQLEQRIQYMIEVMFQIRKDGFKDHAAVIEELDMVNEDDQFTHLLTLDDVKQADTQDILNVFKLDDKYEENETKYKTLCSTLGLDSSSDDEDGNGSGDGDDSDGGDSDDESGEEGKDKGGVEGAAGGDTIIDNTEGNLIRLRRLIYLTIQSSLDFEECAHKLMRMDLKPGQEIELCHMFLDCCAEQRTYEKFYGLLAQRFCQINRIYVPPFEQIFADTYSTAHRLDTNRLRNVSKFFGHLLFTDAIGWNVLETMHLNELETNSSSRIFIKTLFQELAEYMGLGKLNGRLKDATLQEFFTGLFPRDNPKNTTFSINFFTSIGLGGLTDDLRGHLKNVKSASNVKITTDGGVIEDSSSDEDSSSSSSSSSDSSSNSSTEESDSSSGNSTDSSGKRKKKSSKSKKKKKQQSEKAENKEKRGEIEHGERRKQERRDRKEGRSDRKGEKRGDATSEDQQRRGDRRGDNYNPERGSRRGGEETNERRRPDVERSERSKGDAETKERRQKQHDNGGGNRQEFDRNRQEVDRSKQEIDRNKQEVDRSEKRREVDRSDKSREVERIDRRNDRKRDDQTERRPHFDRDQQQVERNDRKEHRNNRGNDDNIHRMEEEKDNSVEVQQRNEKKEHRSRRSDRRKDDHVEKSQQVERNDRRELPRGHRNDSSADRTGRRQDDGGGDGKERSRDDGRHGNSERNHEKHEERRRENRNSRRS